MNIFTLRCIPMLLLLLAMAELKATHIVGGELSYECIEYIPATDVNVFRVTMTIYRNCNNMAMDVFSNPAPIAVYRTKGYTYELVLHKDVFLQPPIVNIPIDIDNPCLMVPPNICVEKGVYHFELVLPVVEESYYISYQR
ncbi:MAG: hypothetical protein AAFP19_14830, partial [Bacteroidota bacterium]